MLKSSIVETSPPLKFGNCNPANYLGPCP
uniref:Uncharacterized protein n=1 Tax=Nelumbo nucifera TaxID=4432 RepID=A0A822ZFK7_NELNU|nr:TPA_asm: hypothetical protein HUJ06_001886 [Nelumbo nucifera]